MKVRTRRWSILAGGLLALSMVGAPAMAAEPSADDPVASVNGLLDTLLAKDFAGIGAFVCAEKRADVTANFDLTQAFEGMPEGVDVEALIAGLVLVTPDRVVTLVSNDGALALVDVVATMTIALDEAAAAAFIGQILEAQGMEVSDEMIAMLLPELTAQFSEGEDLTEQVEVVLEEGRWLVCEDLGDDSDASPSPAASGAPMASPMASPAA